MLPDQVVSFSASDPTISMARRRTSSSEMRSRLAFMAPRSASSGARTASSERSVSPVVSHIGGCVIQMTAPRRSLPAIFIPVMSVAISLACCRLAASRSASRSDSAFEAREVQHRTLHGGAGEIGELQLRAGEIGALQ